MQMTEQLIFSLRPDCFKTPLDTEFTVLSSLLSDIWEYTPSACEQFKLLPVRSLSSKRRKMHQTPSENVHLPCKGGSIGVRPLTPLFSPLSEGGGRGGGREVVEGSEIPPVYLLRDQSSAPQCSVFMPGVLKKCPSVHYISLYLPTVSAGFAEMVFHSSLRLILSPTSVLFCYR